MLTAKFFTCLCTRLDGSTERSIRVEVSDGCVIETKPGRNARRALRRIVVDLYGPCRFRANRNHAPLHSREV